MIRFSFTINNKVVRTITDVQTGNSKLKWLFHYFGDVAKKGDTVKLQYHYLNVEGREIIDTMEEFIKIPPYPSRIIEGSGA